MRLASIYEKQSKTKQKQTNKNETKQNKTKHKQNKKERKKNDHYIKLVCHRELNNKYAFRRMCQSAWIIGQIIFNFIEITRSIAERNANLT